MLLAIDGLDIASDGMVELEGERVLMSEVAERKFLGDYGEIFASCATRSRMEVDGEIRPRVAVS